MSPRCLIVVLATVAVVALVPRQPRRGPQSDAPWSVPRTADGRPDLQGVWDFRTLTPLQRPARRADQAVLSEEEAAKIEETAVQRAAEADLPSEIRTEPLPAGGGGAAVGGYNNFLVRPRSRCRRRPTHVADHRPTRWTRASPQV